MPMRLLLLLMVILLSACAGENVAVPKPRAYPKVTYPEKSYKISDQSYCNFTFEQPVYAVIERDTTFFEEKPDSDCWFNINVPDLNAKIYCSYNPVKDRKGLDKLVQDAFDMAQKHNVKASYIEELIVDLPESDVHGLVFSIDGPAASSYQFFVTDSTRHFLRGALYFNSRANPDSLAPVTAFMRADVNHLISTLKWK